MHELYIYIYINIYRISWDTGAIWIVRECHITQNKYVRFRAYMVLEM